MILHGITIPDCCPDKCKKELSKRNVYMGQGGMCCRCPITVIECEKMILTDYGLDGQKIDFNNVYPKEWTEAFGKWWNEYKDLPVLRCLDGKTVFSF